MRCNLLISVIFAMCTSTALADMKVVTKRARAGEFDQLSDIRCAQDIGEVLISCHGAVARDATSAVLVVTFPTGFKRMLMFEGGEFLRANTTMSGVGTDTDWSLSDGLYRVRVDDQQFEIPVALISGM